MKRIYKTCDLESLRNKYISFSIDEADNLIVESCVDNPTYNTKRRRDKVISKYFNLQVPGIRLTCNKDVFLKAIRNNECPIESTLRVYNYCARAHKVVDMNKIYDMLTNLGDTLEEQVIRLQASIE